MNSPDHAVTIDVGILATNPRGAKWWDDFLTSQRGKQRFTILDLGETHPVVSIRCDHRQHASWLLEHAVRRGVPRHALQLTGQRTPADVDDQDDEQPHGDHPPHLEQMAAALAARRTSPCRCSA